MEVITLIVGSIIVLALLGIIIAFSPTLLLTELAILTRSKQPFFHTLFLILGIAVSVTLISLLALFFIDPHNEIVIPSKSNLLGSVPIADIVVGILLAILGMRLLRVTPETETTPTSPVEFTMSNKTLFWFGFIKMSTSLSSLVAIIFASRIIKTYYTFNTAQFAAAVWLICISIVPFVLLILAKLYRPQLFGKIQHTSDKVSTLNWRRIFAGTILLASIWFMIIGLRNI